jgi:CubicO group peptidase (beta-lactamase class C family)
VQITPEFAMVTPLQQSIDRVVNGLRPISPVEGRPIRWTLAERLSHYQCPGIGIAVVENGATVWSGGFGVFEQGGSRPIDSHTLFAGASISKPVSAMLALQLVDQGLVDLDTDINTYLTRWQLPSNEFTDAAPVTLRLLLGHKAGTTIHGYGGVDEGAARPDVIDMLEGRPPARPPAVRVDKVPGGSARYSGGGFTIVELLIEELTGLPFPEVAAQRLFRPLGMGETTFRHPLPPALAEHTATGHAAGAKPIPGKWVLSPQVAAGGLYTTPKDYARFMIACRDAWLGRPGALLSQPLAREMMQVQPRSTFGLGWEVLHEGANKRFEHGGSNDGFQCMSMMGLETGHGAIVTTNAESGLLLFWEVLAAIADAFDWNAVMPAPRRQVVITAAERALLIGDYQIVDGPPMRIFEQGGVLYSSIPYLRLSTHEMRMDQAGRFFTDYGPWVSEVVRDPAGRVVEIIMLRDGLVEQMRANRNEEPT